MLSAAFPNDRGDIRLFSPALDKRRALGYNGGMKVDQSVEDYLETILLLSQSAEQVHRADVARRLGVSLPAVTKAVRKLCDLDYVRTDGMHIHLTESGLARAREIYGKHVDIARFLVSLGVAGDVAERDACLMEHVVSEQTYAAIRNYLKGADAT